MSSQLNGHISRLDECFIVSEVPGSNLGLVYMELRLILTNQPYCDGSLIQSVRQCRLPRPGSQVVAPPPVRKLSRQREFHCSPQTRARPRWRVAKRRAAGKVGTRCRLKSRTGQALESTQTPIHD